MNKISNPIAYIYIYRYANFLHKKIACFEDLSINNIILLTICNHVANKTKKMKCIFFNNYSTSPFKAYMSGIFNTQAQTNKCNNLEVYPTVSSTPPRSYIIIYIGIKSSNCPNSLFCLHS